MSRHASNGPSDDRRPAAKNRKSGKPAGRHQGRSSGRPGQRGRQGPALEEASDDTVLLFGIHAVEAALQNPNRHVRELSLTQNAARRLETAVTDAGMSFQSVLPKDLDRRLGPDTVHQGALAVCEASEPADLDDLVEAAVHSGRPIIVLDQVTDPHNVGAVLRSAAVFGAAGLVMTRRHSPPLAGTLAKSASGALELIPIALVQNLAKALAALAEAGITIIGLDGDGEGFLEDADMSRPTAIVLGAEGKGLRQSTSAACSAICRIATDGPIASLNVSNAGAIALHLHAMKRRAG